jgi:hypothetical protein
MRVSGEVGRARDEHVDLVTAAESALLTSPLPGSLDIRQYGRRLISSRAKTHCPHLNSTCKPCTINFLLNNRRNKATIVKALTTWRQ